jgi:hypothetical protein
MVPATDVVVFVGLPIVVLVLFTVPSHRSQYPSPGGSRKSPKAK